MKSLIKYHKADDEQHKIIDGINLLFSSKKSELIQYIYEYCTVNVIFPSKNIQIFTDEADGIAVAPADVFREIKLHHITRALDSIVDKRKKP